MPEGPELHLTSKFVNNVCGDRLFSGKVVKSEVSLKNPDVEWCSDCYKIVASSRGKEMKLTLTSVNKKTKKPETEKSLDIVFRFGMSGQFKFDHKDEMHKHAHLNFFVKDTDMVLSFVDVRRFGRWEPNGSWSTERGPCVMFEYDAFRENVLNNLHSAAFNKAICEAMLNQKFFNGVGNYLRAEVLYRAGIAPFVCARDALMPLKDNAGVKTEKDDILSLCNKLALEVINLNGKGYAVEKSDDVYSGFNDWLQCYYQPGMSNVTDGNGRTMWFKGNAGPMVPKEGKSRGTKRHSPTKKKVEKDAPVTKKKKQIKVELEDEDQNTKSKAAKSRRKPAKVKVESDVVGGTTVAKPKLKNVKVKKETKSNLKTKQESQKQKSKTPKCQKTQNKVTKVKKEQQTKTEATRRSTRARKT